MGLRQDGRGLEGIQADAEGERQRSGFERSEITWSALLALRIQENNDGQGKWFMGWTDATGPFPISVTNGHWGKKLCALFEWIAVLETEASKPNADAHGRRSRTVQPLVGHSESGAE